VTRTHVVPALILSVALCAGVVGLRAGQSVDSRLQKGASTISAEQTFGFVKKMASPEFGGRFTGHPKYAAAARWAAGEFKAMGLRPISPTDGYLQPYSSPTGTIDAARLEVIRGATRTTAAIPRHFLPMVFSDAGTITAGTVFVGWGIHAPDLGYDDYAGVDVKGKLVLCFRGTPDSDPKWIPHDAHRYRMKTARDLGAAGLVYIYPEVIVNNNSDLIKGFYQALISEETADQVLADKSTSVAVLKKQLRDTKKPASLALDAVFDMSVKTHYTANATTYNVVGYVEGADPALRSELVVVGAHFDAVGEHVGILFPGADDNASGSAVVMAAAQALAKNDARPKRSVMFVLFSGEEMGSSGAEYFVAHLPAPGKTVVAFLNYDMEGLGDKIGGALSPALLASRSLLDQADAGLGIVGQMSEARGMGNRSGDVAPFFAKGYPIASIMSNGKRPAFSYHLPGDSIEIVQPAFMAKVAQLTYRWAFLLADK
jgi:hypothetical protein